MVCVHYLSVILLSTDLINLLLSPSKDHLSPEFAGSVLKFFNKLLYLGEWSVNAPQIENNFNVFNENDQICYTFFFFVLADKHPTHKSYEALCSSLSRIADPDFDKSVLQNWLSKFIFSSEVGSIKFL